MIKTKSSKVESRTCAQGDSLIRARVLVSNFEKNFWEIPILNQLITTLTDTGFFQFNTLRGPAVDLSKENILVGTKPAF